MQTSQPGGDIVVANVRLPYDDKDLAMRTWTVECHEGRVSRVLPSSKDPRCTERYESEKIAVHSRLVDGKGGLMLPSFCHSHIHLDKCFILDRCGNLVKGNFEEAMRVTKVAKADFPKHPDDLYSRGARTIRESVEHGVTAMRAHVEVDSSVGFACLEVAQRLQEDYLAHCDVQIAIFAQEPLFDSVESKAPGENFILLKEAALRHGVSVVGSAPYVEPSIKQAKLNIGFILDIADAQRVDHVDFHLDYNLDASSEPLIYEVIAQAKRRYEHVNIRPDTTSDPDAANSALDQCSSGNNARRPCPRIIIGHATRLQLFSPEQWRELANSISGLPITFVGLPQSDIYMQGRAFQDEPLGAPRGTLRVPYIARKYGIEIAMSVNNVENAFTPQGSLDPLSLCAFGVAIFQAATPEDIRTLVHSVTLTSKRAIGLEAGGAQGPADLLPRVGELADFVILHERGSLQSAVLNPCFDRTTIKGGRVVASRRSVRWIAP